MSMRSTVESASSFSIARAIAPRATMLLPRPVVGDEESSGRGQSVLWIEVLDQVIDGVALEAL